MHTAKKRLSVVDTGLREWFTAGTTKRRKHEETHEEEDLFSWLHVSPYVGHRFSGADIAPCVDMSRPRRLKEFDYLGLHHYFVTVCVLDRRQVFTDAAVVESARSHFLKQSAMFACAIIAYCFMPDHVHLLIDGTMENADLKSFVARAKQKSGFDFATGHRHRLWQKGYYDRVLRDDEPIPDVIRYIIENPARAGLVVEPREYPFWGSGVYTREELLEFASVQTTRHR